MFPFWNNIKLKGKTRNKEITRVYYRLCRIVIWAPKEMFKYEKYINYIQKYFIFLLCQSIAPIDMKVGKAKTLQIVCAV